MESELVSGFFTEHSSVPFVSFFLAEYGSILLLSILTSILFLGGYNFSFDLISIKDLSWIIFNDLHSIKEQFSFIEQNPFIIGLIYGLALGVKTCIIVFAFIWVRASMPRIRYDQLMMFCWTVLLPLLFAFIFIAPCILYSFEALPISLIMLPLAKKTSDLNPNYVSEFVDGHIIEHDSHSTSYTHFSNIDSSDEDN